jgi:RNA recognition motif-containing protein
MPKKLFIGGLSWNTNEEGLRAAFEQYGELDEVKVVVDRNTNRSRGFGFITFQNDADAQTAIEEMDGKELDGRTIKVDVAQDRGPRRDGDRPRYNRDDRDRNRW